MIESINADSVLALSAPRTVDQLIGARTPGVIILPATGQVGTGAQIRVRAVGSLSLNNDPIVYIDGVRMDSDPSQGPAQRGSAGASRLDDINPEDIESIEIIKGPAAATLYGTEASNGVVQVITKRGSTGAAKWDFSGREGSNWLQNPEGRAGLLWGKDSTGALQSVNLYKYSIDHGNGPIFTTGRNQGYAMNLSGGTDITRYYLSSNVDHDVGVVPWNWERKFGGRVQPRHRAEYQAPHHRQLGLHPRPRPPRAAGRDQPGSVQQSRMGRRTKPSQRPPAASASRRAPSGTTSRITPTTTARPRASPRTTSRSPGSRTR